MQLKFPIIQKTIDAPPHNQDSKVQFILKELPEIFNGINTEFPEQKITNGLKVFSRNNRQSVIFSCRSQRIRRKCYQLHQNEHLK